MKSYTIDKKYYYNMDELKEQYPKIFKAYNNSRTFIDKTDIEEGDYIYARKNDRCIWEKSDGLLLKLDKIFILVDWFQKNYLNDSDEFDNDNNDNDNMIEIEDAPKIIELNDNEKFIDDNDNMIEIEIRGERKINKCYFNVKDLIKEFDLPYLHTNILKNKSEFENNEHYKYFYLQNEGVVKNSSNHKVKKLYLTYFGLLTVLFASNKETTKKFVSWATETLFMTQQMNSLKDKSALVSNMLGVPMKAVKNVLSKTSNKISCNYLISIGIVKKLRKWLDISKTYSDKDFVYKYGMSEDLKRRIGEIKRMFKHISAIKVELVIFNYIDPQFISEAETRVKNIIHNYGLKLVHEKYTELAIIPTEKMNFIKEQYNIIAKIYRGSTLELSSQLKEKDMIIKDKEFIIREKEHIIQSMIAQKEIEKLKMQLESHQSILSKTNKYFKKKGVCEETNIFLSNEDTITAFLDQIIIKTGNDKDIIKKTEMYKIYKLFACNYDKIANSNNFQTILESKGYPVRRKDGYDVYRGIIINKTKMDEKLAKIKQ